MKLSFAHAEGRNYWQLPARGGCVRSRRLPISSALRDKAFPGLMKVGEMLFSAQEYSPKGYSGLVCALAAEIKRGRSLVKPCDMRGLMGVKALSSGPKGLISPIFERHD